MIEIQFSFQIFSDFLTMKVQKIKQKQDGGIGKSKKCKTTSKKNQTPSNNSINRMDEAILRFPHLPEQVFQKLDNKSLTNSMVVGASWHNFIDTRDYPWKCFQGVVDDLTEKCKNGWTAFHLACENGQAGIEENIIKNSVRLNIDLNAKYRGWIAFRLACSNGQSEIVDMLIKNSNDINIDLNAKDNAGRTAFHFACMLGKTSIIEIMINKSESHKIDLAARDVNGRTGYQLAQRRGKSKVLNLIKSKIPNLAF